MFNIAVVGCGVVGLTSALQIQKDIKNAKVTIFTEKFSPNTTGDISAGLWTPYLLEDTPKSDITRWSKITHDKLSYLWRNGYAEKAGICLLPVLKLNTERNIELPEWKNIPFGAVMLAPEQVKKISKQHGKNYTAAFHFVSFTCEPTKLLPFLMQEFLENGGNVVQKKVTDLQKLRDYDVIINCAGFEARTLTNDKMVHAIRGQICRVKAPWQFHVVMDDSDDGNYIIPNISYVILGGTHQIDNENLAVCPIDKERILRGCAQMSPGLVNCQEHLDGVGLRPGRNKVRLDSETVILGNKKVHIVHNYGHGGSGVTLCFGCAEDASKLVQQALKKNNYITSHL